MKQWYKITDRITYQIFKNTCNWTDAGMGMLASSIQSKKTGEIRSLCYNMITQEIFILKEVQ